MSRHREWDLKCKVYVGNMGSNTARGDLEASFSKYGSLKNVWVARNPPGFAFVEFEDPRDAEDAVRALDGTRICGTRVRVEMSSGRSRRERPPPQRHGQRSDFRGRYTRTSRGVGDAASISLLQLEQSYSQALHHSPS